MKPACGWDYQPGMLYNHIFPLAGGASCGSSESSQQLQRQPQTVVEGEEKEKKKLMLPPAKPHIVSEMKGFEQEEPTLQTQEQKRPGEVSGQNIFHP